MFDLPDKDVLRLEAPGTYTSGNPVFQAAGVQPGTEPNSAFPTSSASWRDASTSTTRSAR